MSCKHEPPILLPGVEFTGIEFKADGHTIDFTNFDRDRNPEHENWVKGNLHVLCPYKNCQIDICQFCGIIVGGMGPMLCPCDHTRGWKAKRVESMGKPHPAIKPTGRHKGKIERRRREMRAFNNWMKSLTQSLDRMHEG